VMSREVQRTPEEIQEKHEELCYQYWQECMSGVDSPYAASQLKLLQWLFKEEETLLLHGKWFDIGKRIYDKRMQNIGRKI